MLQWPGSPPSGGKRRSEESGPAFADLPSPPVRRWTLGVPKHAAGQGRFVLEPIENEKSERSQKHRLTPDKWSLASIGSRRSSRQSSLPPLDMDDGDLEDGRRLKGCRGASEYLARQDPSNGLSAYEQFFVKEAFLRFKSSGAEINCSDVYDVLIHLGYLGITDDAATLLAKEVSRFSTLDFKELLRVVESAGAYERQQLQSAFNHFATSKTSKVADEVNQETEDEAEKDKYNGSDEKPECFLHVAQLPFLLHSLGMTSDWQAIRETLLEALDRDFPHLPRLSDADERMEFSFSEVNLILATHRAAHCSSLALLECAESLFCSVAKTEKGRLEVNIHRVPELLRRLHEYDVSESVLDICNPAKKLDQKKVMKAQQISGPLFLRRNHFGIKKSVQVWLPCFFGRVKGCLVESGGVFLPIFCIKRKSKVSLLIRICRKWLNSPSEIDQSPESPDQ